MNTSRDPAHELTNALPAPFPTALRRKVFVPASFLSHHHYAMMSEWLRWGGDSDFITDPARAEECGICIFTEADLPNDHEFTFICPFFQRHGREANVFKYQPREKTFWRVNPEWIASYYPI